MKKFKLVILILLLVGLLQLNLFSLITSRIEGKVVDEFGNPIEKVIIRLYHLSYINKVRAAGLAAPQQSTDASGSFKFDDLKKGEYFLQIFKEGYAAIGPLMNYDRVINPPNRRFVPFCDPPLRKPIKYNSFALEEGHIKHLVIEMKKEAVLILKVTPVGANVTDKFDFEFGHSGYCDRVKYGGEGEYKSKCLDSGKVDIIFYVNAGYPRKIYKGIDIKSGETTEVEYILDFTKRPLIHGFVIDKDTKKPLKTRVSIYGIENIDTMSDENGEYWIGGFPPSKYKISIRGKWDDSIQKYKRYKTIIEIAENEKKEINVEI